MSKTAAFEDSPYAIVQFLLMFVKISNANRHLALSSENYQERQ